MRRLSDFRKRLDRNPDVGGISFWKELHFSKIYTSWWIFFSPIFFHSTGDKISNVIAPKKPSPFQNKRCCSCCLRAVSGHKLPITYLLSVTGWWILMNEMKLDFSQRFCSDSIPNPSTYCCLESNCVWREMLQQAIIFFEHYYCAHGKQASHNL